MGLLGDIAAAVDRVLDRVPVLIEPVVRAAARKEKHELLAALSEPHPQWRSLAALMKEIGYDPGRERLQDRTVYFLRHLPQPLGPARTDRSTTASQKPRLEWKFGLVGRVGR